MKRLEFYSTPFLHPQTEITLRRTLVFSCTSLSSPTILWGQECHMHLVFVKRDIVPFPNLKRYWGRGRRSNQNMEANPLFFHAWVPYLLCFLMMLTTMQMLQPIPEFPDTTESLIWAGLGGWFISEDLFHDYPHTCLARRCWHSAVSSARAVSRNLSSFHMVLSTVGIYDYLTAWQPAFNSEYSKAPGCGSFQPLKNLNPETENPHCYNILLVQQSLSLPKFKRRKPRPHLLMRGVSTNLKSTLIY